MAPPVRSILWVDDEAELLEPHRRFLTDRGFEVASASNADDAAELLRRRPFDLVLLDEQMPGKRCLEAFREISEIAPSMPVIMVTKSEEDDTLSEALGADVREYLVKPVSPRQVLTMVTKVLDGPRLKQQALARRFVEVRGKLCKRCQLAVLGQCQTRAATGVLAFHDLGLRCTTDS